MTTIKLSSEQKLKLPDVENGKKGTLQKIGEEVRIDLKQSYGSVEEGKDLVEMIVVAGSQMGKTVRRREGGVEDEENEKKRI